MENAVLEDVWCEDVRWPAQSEHDPRRYRVSRSGGCVVCNQPARYRAGGYTAEQMAQVIRSAVDEWNYYGGFLICESCSNADAERIAAALNFIEGLPLDFVQRAQFARLLPTCQWDGQESK